MKTTQTSYTKRLGESAATEGKGLKVPGSLRAFVAFGLATAFVCAFLPSVEGTVTTYDGVTNTLGGNRVIGGTGDGMIVTNAGVAINGNGFLGRNPSASNNFVIITGSGSIWSNTAATYVGSNSGDSNTLIIAQSGTVYSVGTASIGYDGSDGSNSNLVRVTDSGSAWYASTNLLVGGAGWYNQLIVSNGGMVSSRDGVVGNDGSFNAATVTGGGSVWTNTTSLTVGNSGANNSLTIANGGVVYGPSITLGLVNAGANNLVTVTGSNSVLNVGSVNVGHWGDGNQMIVSNGGAVIVSADSVIGNRAESSNAVVTVTGVGSTWNMNGDLKVGSSGDNSRLIVTDGGTVINSNTWLGFAGAGSLDNNILLTQGGTLDTLSLQKGSGTGTGTLTNSGGIVQFRKSSPTITAGGYFVTTNGTISFRGVDNAPVTPLSGMTYQGANTFRLNGSSNVTGVSSYTFNTGLGASNYTRLEMVNDTTHWRSGNLTVGSGGSLLASNTTATVSASVISTGSISVVNSRMTWSSNVIIAGSYVSDPSTNTFLADATVTPSGSLAGGVGDLFDFKKNLIIQSTNNQAFELHTSAVQFSGGGMHTNEITGLDLGAGPFAYDSAFTLGTNFAYGELHLGSASDEICFSCTGAASSNALYVGWLDLLGDTNYVAKLHAPSNITIYYALDDVRNAYLGNQSYNLLDCDGALGGLLMPVVPEPTTMAFMVVGGALLLRRRREETNRPR